MPHMAGATAVGTLPGGIATMRPRAHLRKPAIVTRRLSSFVVRAAIVTFMSFAVAFGFLAGATSPAAHYDPYMFAIGVASLFGAACGAMGILIARIRRMKAELRERPVIASWDRLIDYCRAHIAYGMVEEFHLLFLDRKNALIAHEQQQRGTIVHSFVRKHII